MASLRMQARDVCINQHVLSNVYHGMWQYMVTYGGT